MTKNKLNKMSVDNITIALDCPILSEIEPRRGANMIFDIKRRANKAPARPPIPNGREKLAPCKREFR